MVRSCRESLLSCLRSGFCEDGMLVWVQRGGQVDSGSVLMLVLVLHFMRKRLLGMVLSI